MTTANSQAMPRPFVYAPPEDPYLSVIYSDAFILALDKPSGLLTVAGKDPAHADCLESRARSEFPGARIVHRLDKDTSGVIVLGLTAAAHAHLGLQFEKRHTKKSYIARVSGHVAEQAGCIDKPITTDWPNRPRQHIDHERGRRAVTDWEVLGHEHGSTRVRLTPHTGRSHQLRVHMLDLGHPILGDNIYAPDAVLAAAPCLQLHAESLAIRHPNGGTPMTFTAPCPF